MDSWEWLDALGAVAMLAILLLAPAVGTWALVSAQDHRDGHAEVEPRTARWIQRCARVLAWMPSAFLVGFAILIASVWFETGALPTPVRPTPWIAIAPFSGGPAPFEYDPLRAALGVLWLANVAAILVVPPSIGLAHAVERPVGRTTVIVYAVTWVGSIVLAVADPGDAFEWAFLD